MKKVTVTGSKSAPEMEEFVAGEVVFRQGEPATVMYIVREGAVEISRGGPEGRRVIAKLEKGDLFGESAVLDSSPRSCDARAVDKSLLMPIDAATFDRLLRKNPEIAVRIMRKLLARIRALESLLEASGEDESGEKKKAAAAGNARDVRCLFMHEESGTVLEVELSRSRMVGRGDPVTGLVPDVDLSEVDPERSSSRQHAKVFSEGERFFVVEDVGTTNGTFVNGERVKSGVPAEISSGDQVRFGLVDLLFRVV